MIQFALDFLSSSSESYLFLLFCGLFMQKRDRPVWFYFAYFFLVCIIQLVTYMICPVIVFRMSVSFIIDVILLGRFFYGKIQKRLLCTGLFNLFLIIIEVIISTLFNELIPNFNYQEMFRSHGLLAAVSTAIVRLLQYAIVLSAIWFKKRPIRQKVLKSYLVMPAITILFASIVYPRFWSMKDERINELLICIAIFLIVQNFFTLANIATVQNSTKRYFEVKAVLDRQKQYAATVAAIQRTVRKMGHNMRHHFVYLKNALNQNEIAKAQDYLDQLDESLDSAIPLGITGNFNVDALLHDKHARAKEREITLRVEGEIPPAISISPLDINVLLGNALDNAMEASSRLEGNKEIEVVFCYSSGRLHFTITNPYNAAIRLSKTGRFLSSKPKGGLGVEIMNDIVAKYDGRLITDYSDQRFTLTAIINVGETQRNDTVLPETL